MKTFFERAAYALAGVLFALAAPAVAATIYSAGSLLQIGDVKTSHILDATVLDEDISGTAKISGTKVAGGGAGGLVLLSNNTRLATSTNLKFATSTNDLYVLTGRIHATSTNFGGWNQAWPSADGTNGQLLSTDGAATLGWTNASSVYTSSSLTAGEAINTGDAVVVASSTTVINTVNSVGTDNTVDCGRTVASYQAANFSTTTTYRANFLGVTISKVGSPTDNFYFEVNGNSGGVPDDISQASTTVVAGATLSGSNTYYELAFPTPFTFTAGTTYWIVCRRSGALDDTNYFQSSRNTTNQNRGGVDYYYLPGWTTTVNQYSRITVGFWQQSGNVYRAKDTTDNLYKNFIGFATATTTASSTVSVVTSGVADAVQGVRAGLLYYLSNVSGGVLTTAGAGAKKVGVGIGGGKIIVTNIW